MMMTKRIKKTITRRKKTKARNVIATRRLERMKRGSKHKKYIKSMRLKVTWVMASYMLHQ
jgi:hypothetical protein